MEFFELVKLRGSGTITNIVDTPINTNNGKKVVI